MSAIHERVIQQLKADEGFSQTSYWDNDQWTWGYGTKAPGEGAEITRVEAEKVLQVRVGVAFTEFSEVFGYSGIDEPRMEALVNMIFNLGKAKFLLFRKMIRAIEARDWGRAAYEAYDSLWFRQLRRKGLQSIERSERIVWTLLTGER